MDLLSEELHKIGDNGFHKLLKYDNLYIKPACFKSVFAHRNNCCTIFSTIEICPGTSHLVLGHMFYTIYKGET